MFFVDFELPLASLWVPMGSLFGTVCSTLFFNVKTVAKIEPKWNQHTKKENDMNIAEMLGIIGFSTEWVRNPHSGI